jgi:AcrR family transcriptional regulator
MTLRQQNAGRKSAVSKLKRKIILDAARSLFEEQGLDGTSLRGIAKEAGYTPAALYFHFDSKEAIYGEVLQDSLYQLSQRINSAIDCVENPPQKLKLAAMTFFSFYDENPRDLDLGFYLFRGGMKPVGLGKERDQELNQALKISLMPIAEAAIEMGSSVEQSQCIMVDMFAHATGLLLLAHTGRIRLFGVSATEQMQQYVEQQLNYLKESM